MKVFKFGGASVKDASAYRNVAEIVRLYPKDKLIIVISAMGKTTNALEELVRSYFHKDRQKQRHLKQIRMFHKDIVEDLFHDKSHSVYAEIGRLFQELSLYIKSEPGSNFDYEYDQVVAYGELLSSCLLSHYLIDVGIGNSLLNASDVIMTDDNFREGRVYWPQTIRLIRQKLKDFATADLGLENVIVTQGFIGRSPDGPFTTLGREGSDYSAAIFGHAMEVEEVVIWKDVEGLLDADPKLFSNAKLIETISYHETIELSFYGASIIHPKTIQPLENKNIPLCVKSFLNPQLTGSVIKRIEGTENPPSSIIVKENQMLISIASTDFSFIAEKNLQNIFRIFAELAVRINVMQNSAISFSVIIDDPQYKKKLLLSELSAYFKVRYNEGLKLITIRHYTPEIIRLVTGDSEILLEQKSRFTYQAVIR